MRTCAHKHTHANLHRERHAHAHTHTHMHTHAGLYLSLKLSSTHIQYTTVLELVVWWCVYVGEGGDILREMAGSRGC